MVETYFGCDASSQQSHSQSLWLCEARWLCGSVTMQTLFLNISRCHPWERLCRASRSLSSAVRPLAVAYQFPSVKLSPGCSAPQQTFRPCSFLLPRSQFRPSPFIPRSPIAANINECFSGCARPRLRIVACGARISALGVLIERVCRTCARPGSEFDRRKGSEWRS